MNKARSKVEDLREALAAEKEADQALRRLTPKQRRAFMGFQNAAILLGEAAAPGVLKASATMNRRKLALINSLTKAEPEAK